MGLRREQRTKMMLPVRIWGMDSEGSLFEVEAHTLDVTTTGARLQGIHLNLHRGANIGIQCGRSSARFRVTWVGAAGGPKHGQIGVQLLDAGKCIWGVALTRVMGDEHGPHTAAV